MSLQALAKAFNAEMEPVNKLVLIYLSDMADEDDIAVPHFAKLAHRAGISEQDLRRIIDGFIYLQILEPAAEHPFDMFAGTEGFKLHLESLEQIPEYESPWIHQLRLVE